MIFLPAILAALGPIVSSIGSGLGAAGSAVGGALSGALGGIGSALGGGAGVGGGASAVAPAAAGAITPTASTIAPVTTGISVGTGAALPGAGGGGAGASGGFLSGITEALGMGGGELGGLSGEALGPEMMYALTAPEYGLDAGVTLVPMGEGAVGQASFAAPGGAVQVGPELASASGLPTSSLGADDWARWAKRASDLTQQEDREEAPPPPMVATPQKQRQPMQPVDLDFANFLNRVKMRGTRPAGVIGIESL